MNHEDAHGSVIDRASLPPLFPTQMHSPQFWEQLGRAIATYGYLEEVLGKAVFVFTATRKYRPEEVDEAYRAWLPQLERALTGKLWNLADAFGKAARDNPATATEDVDELIHDIKRASPARYVLSHSSWRAPDAHGASVPFFVTRQKEVSNTPMSLARLEHIRAHAAELACRVMDTVTLVGLPFPGGGGPGKPLIEKS